MEKDNANSKRSMNMRALIRVNIDELDEYKRDVDHSVTRRLYSPHESSARKRSSTTDDDFVPREGRVLGGKLYDPYTDQMINSWQETSYGQMQRAPGAEKSELKSRGSSKHSRGKSANESLMTDGIINDANFHKEVARKEVTYQDPNMKVLTLLTKELVQLEKEVSE